MAKAPSKGRRRSLRSAGAPRTGRARKQDATLKANLAAIREHRPELVRLAATPADGKRINAVTGPAGELLNIVRRNPDGSAIPWHQGDLGPELDALWARTDWVGRSLVAVLGLGAGQELNRLMSDRTLLPRRVVVIEPDADVFRTVIRHTNLASAFANPHLRFHIGRPIPELRARLTEYFGEPPNLRYVKTLTVLAADGAMATAADYHRQALKSLQGGTLAALRAIGNAPQDSLLGLENMLRNLPVIIGSAGIGPLFGRFKGKPAVVASAGPSLAKQFERLRDIQDEVLIICPDTSLKALLPQGIRPHLVCSRERTPSIVRHFRGVGDDGVRLAGVPVIDPRCYEGFAGPSVSVFRRAAHFQWLGLERGYLDFQASGGNMAFRLAQELGCDPVILVGQDLAYSDAGDTHAVGTMHGRVDKDMEGFQRVKVPGNSGRPVISTPSWIRYRERFEHDIAQHDGVCVNATEGGALIRGAQVATFEQAIERHLGPAQRQPVRDRLTELLAPPGEADQAAQAKAVHDQIARTRTLMDELMGQCREGMRLGREIAQRATAAAALREQPVDVRQLLTQPPLDALEQLRTRITRMDLFQEFVMPTALPVLLHWDVRVFGLQIECADAEQLYSRVLPEFSTWFTMIEQLTQRSLDLLPWGEHSLRAAFPDAVPPPGQALPPRTMVEIISDTNPDILYE